MLTPELTTKFSKRQVLVAFYAALVAFLAYASVYAYRKPFTVATFEGESYFGISYQSLLIISQGLGYMLSKFRGIKFISELKLLGRWKTSVILIGSAWLCLLLFAIVPAPFGMLCLFVNGFMLGFMWGIVFSYVEGRRATDFIGSVLAVSFIFAGGFTRSVGKWLMLEWGITQQWMPFMTGLELCVALKKHEATRSTPALMLTARGFSLASDAIGKTNIVGVLSKPFSPREVLTRVQEMLGRPVTQEAGE